MVQRSSVAAGRLTLKHLEKSFEGRPVVRDVSMEVAAGEFFSLLGPSGCGKTTTLRMIAGFEQPDAGTIEIDDQAVGDWPPEKRPVTTVFQNYALFPHLDVAQNVGFGLRFTDLDRSAHRRLIGEALDRVRLSGFESRRVHRLSGGEQQRVALARALVLRPRVLLLDEPLGALDAQLRKQLQTELTTIQREVGITFVYVTHDQEEALTMSDRIGLMLGGSLREVGRPRDLYDAPSSLSAARFLGVANVFTGPVVGSRLELGSWSIPAPPSLGGSEATVMIRPERVRLVDGAVTASGRVVMAQFAGTSQHVTIDMGGIEVRALVSNDGRQEFVSPGQVVNVEVDPRDVITLSAD